LHPIHKASSMDNRTPSLNAHWLPALSFRFGIAQEQRKCSDLNFIPARIDVGQAGVSAAIEQARQEERNRIGGELHDNISQLLVTSKLLLTLMQADPRQADEVLPKAIELLSKSINDVRSYAHAIANAGESRKPLVAEIETLLEMVTLAAGIEIHFPQEAKDNLSVDRRQETDLYRIVQEAIHNIIKHAGATRVEIACQRSGERLELTICDNGKGFDPFEVEKGAGLQNMHQRALRLQALCMLDTSPGKGTSVFISLPVNVHQLKTA